MGSMRLDRFLSEMGCAARSQIREDCKKGRIRCNGETVKKPDLKIDPDRDTVEYCGEVVRYASMEYYMLNKPQGVVTATEDKRQRTVLDLLDGRHRKDLFPVGRLDKDTEGLLLITNDGPLCQHLLSPKHHVGKTYEAVVEGQMTEDMIGQFREGLDIGDETLTRPAELVILESGERSRIRLTITEGRYHQVKRMCAAVGCPVMSLKRLSMGPLVLDEDLTPGDYRELTEEEIRELRST